MSIILARIPTYLALHFIISNLSLCSGIKGSGSAITLPAATALLLNTPRDSARYRSQTQLNADKPEWYEIKATPLLSVIPFNKCIE